MGPSINYIYAQRGSGGGEVRGYLVVGVGVGGRGGGRGSCTRMWYIFIAANVENQGSTICVYGSVERPLYIKSWP